MADIASHPGLPNRALGAADTISRLLNTSDVGYIAGAAQDDGPLLRAPGGDGPTTARR